MSSQQLALVTGGSRGIGLATAQKLCERGVQVIFTCRNPHDGQMILMENSQLVKYLDFHPLEVTDKESVNELVDYIERKYGWLDILVNNAGVNYDTWQRASRVSISEVEYTIDVNLLGPWRLCNALIPLFLEQGSGRIINVSSGAGRLENQDGSTPAYSLSKNGLNMLTRSLAADLQNTGISVNGVDPGWVRTAMGSDRAPLSPRQGADTIVWLATEVAAEITGCFFRERTEIPW